MTSPICSKRLTSYELAWKEQIQEIEQKIQYISPSERCIVHELCRKVTDLYLQIKDKFSPASFQSGPVDDRPCSFSTLPLLRDRLDRIIREMALRNLAHDPFILTLKAAIFSRDEALIRHYFDSPWIDVSKYVLPALIDSVDAKNFSIIDYLLSRPEAFSQLNHLKQGFMYHAGLSGDLDIINLGLQRLPIEQSDVSIDQCVIAAASKGHIAVVQRLIEQAYLISDWGKQEAFMQAVCSEQISIASYIGSLGLRLDHRSFTFCIDHALSHKNEDLILFLISNYRDLYSLERDLLVVNCSMLGMARALDHLLSQGSISFSAHEQANLFAQQLEREDLLSLLENASVEQLNNFFLVPI
jgi:hypothetical protein